MSFEIVVVLLLILAGGFFAMAEMAVISVRKSKLQELSENGSANAHLVLTLLNEPERFLSAQQLAFTLITTLTGVFSGATLSDFLVPMLRPLLGVHAETVSFSIVVITVTYVTIVIGELVPKSAGLAYAEKIALFCARPLWLLSRLTSPIVTLLAKSNNIVLSILNLNGAQKSNLTQNEIEIVVAQGAKSGVLDSAEHKMVEGVFKLGDSLVSLLVTRRNEVIFLDVNDSLAINLDKMASSHHSHFPLCDGSLDKVLGMINVKDVLARVARYEGVELKSLVTTPLYLPDNIPAITALVKLREQKVTIGLVLDEYGNLEGLIAIQDLVEAIIGEVSRSTNTEQEVVIRQDGSYSLDGQLTIEKVKEVLGLDSLPDEERGDYETLAGMVLKVLGTIPKIGDRFHFEGLNFEVLDMDGNRIDRVLVQKESVPDQGAGL